MLHVRLFSNLSFSNTAFISLKADEMLSVPWTWRVSRHAATIG